jgi:hypothetical protein
VKQQMSVFVAIILVTYSTLLMGQDIIELPKPKISNTYSDVMKKVEEIKGRNRSEAINLLKKALSKEKSPYERYSIIFSELSFLYAEGGQYQECLKVLKEGQDEGLFFPLMKTPRTWPEYYDSLAAQSGFSSFIERNNQLKEEALKSAKLEYLVQLPTGYEAGKRYPLLMVMHGGIGSHIGSSTEWHSPKLDSEYVVACVQGSAILGSFLCSYQQSDIANIAVAYRQVVQKYSIDTSRVILGGVSAGGAIAIGLVMRGHIPATGWLLAVPVKPQSLDELQPKLDEIAKTGMRAAFLCGEHDDMIKIQKEMGVTFDKHNIPNRFIVASGIGHEYSKDFPKEIDLSLEFISKRE